jgi:DNA processing protein
MKRIARPLAGPERVAWLRLSRSELVGPVNFFVLLEAFGSAQRALEALPDLARRSRRQPLRMASQAEVEREIEELDRLGAALIGWSEPEYPEALAATEGAPPLIAYRGERSLLARQCLAVVGARNASTNGCRLAEKLARDLGQAHFVIVSGMARGIDTAAHKGALESGTIAVVAGGIDVCYPPENRRLFEMIAERGVIVAEQRIGTVPVARHFPQRNRIISGLARGVVVVEAALRSGSLITARLALEQGREVFAVPGSPLDPRCHGTNNLIRQGAALTERADDVIAGLGAPPPMNADNAAFDAPRSAAHRFGDSERGMIVERLSPSPTAVDQIVRDTELPAAVVAMALLELELAGRLERHPGNRVALLDV